MDGNRTAPALHEIWIELVCSLQNCSVPGNISSYSSRAHICRYARKLRFETFVDMINDKTPGSVIFDSLRCVEQILFNICFVSAICEHTRAIFGISEKKFVNYVWSIFLQLVSLSFLPIYTKCLQATNSVSQVWFSAIRRIPGMLNFELLTSVPCCTLFGPCKFSGCHWRLLRRRSSLLNGRTRNRLPSVFWRAEILTSYCASGIRSSARVLFLLVC